MSNLFARQEGEHRNTSGSFSQLWSTLLPLLIISVPLFFAFLYLRVKQRRVYAPRTFLEALYEEEQTPKLQKDGLFNWIPEFAKRPDEEVLDHQSMESYLFIRFMKMVTRICLFGVCITWPILIFVNGRGGGGQLELDKLTFSNVDQPNQYYWHAICAIVFVAFIMYIITKETIYYINLRHAYLLTPRNASRVSTRTVLFTSVPDDYLDERWLRAEFAHVRRVWFATDCKELESLVSQMESVAFKLEDAEIKLITKATKRGRQQPEDRPYERVVPLVGRKIDAIDSYRAQLPKLITAVKQEQHFQRTGNAKRLPAVFVEFETQRAATAAFQSNFWRQPGAIEPRVMGSPPEEIVWSNLSIPRPSRYVRTVIANIVITLLILFWSIPVGLVGALTDIDSLTKSLPFLNFINSLPSSAMGVITGLLPALLLSVLLALVPIICRLMAVQAGSVTYSQIELRTQGWYFAFQVVQAFLVTTFSSGASSIAKEIVNDPTKAPKLLAQNLPRASNFYLSFFILQGIAVGASTIFQIAPFLIFNFVYRWFDSTPRKKFNRWVQLSGISWGDTYPKLTNFAVIALAYSAIAPLVLGFATVGLGLLYLAFRYNVFFALTTNLDTKGDAYGKALQHLTVGVYLVEICLIGLFAAGGNESGTTGPAMLMTLVLVLTILYQVYINLVLTPFENSLSAELLAEDEAEALEQARLESGDSDGTVVEDGALKPSNPTPNNSIGGKLAQHCNQGGFFANYLFHGTKSTYPALKRRLRSGFPGQPVPPLPADVADTAYFNPAVTAPVPKLWIPRDRLGISAKECKESAKVIEMSDDGASVDEKGRVIWDEEHLKNAPLWKDRVEF